jgi:hypothetical protein
MLRPRSDQAATRHKGDLVGVGVPAPRDAGEDLPTQFTFEGPGRRRQEFTVVLRSILWDAKWFSWKGMTYEDKEGWQRLFGSEPLDSSMARSIEGDWAGRSPAEGVPADHFALLATTKFKFVAASYRFDVVSDDGFRLLVDGKPVIDRWNHHGPTPDSATVELSAGVHDLRVEYCQEAGAAVLRLDWRRV